MRRNIALRGKRSDLYVYIWKILLRNVWNTYEVWKIFLTQVVSALFGSFRFCLGFSLSRKAHVGE